LKITSKKSIPNILSFYFKLPDIMASATQTIPTIDQYFEYMANITAKRIFSKNSIMYVTCLIKSICKAIDKKVNLIILDISRVFMRHRTTWKLRRC